MASPKSWFDFGPFQCRVNRAAYRGTQFPFKVAFSLLAHWRADRTPPTLAQTTKDNYLDAHTREYFKEQWLYGYPRVYDLLSHFQPSTPRAEMRVLSLGPRTEIELYYLCFFFGFKWENITGVDLVSPTPKIVLGDMSVRIPFPDNSFDLIVASHCLEKSRDPIKTRDEIYRVAKSGARMLTCGNRFVGELPKSLQDPSRPFPLNAFKDGVHGFIDVYRVPLKNIEFLNAISPNGFEIIFKLEK